MRRDMRQHEIAGPEGQNRARQDLRRKTYRQPQLIEFGNVKNLTQGKTIVGSDGIVGSHT